MHAAAPAGFWIRVVAVVIDVIALTIVQMSFESVAAIVFGADSQHSWSVAGTVSFFTLVFFMFYATVLHATTGQTIGKLVAGVRVVALDGEPPPAGAAFLRWLGYFVSGATLGLGFVMAGLRTDKRGLHDLIAGTRVERVPRARRRAVPVSGDAPQSDPGAPTESATTTASHTAPVA
jgi:uncharacterized RDD family membrane protein YckC